MPCSKTSDKTTEQKNFFRFLYWSIALSVCLLSTWSAGHWTKNLELQRITKKANKVLKSSPAPHLRPIRPPYIDGL